jgi:acetoin utilization deacetylase AcuC-like enzyme
VLVAYDDAFTRHLAGAGHLEDPDRVQVVAAELAARGMMSERIAVRPATRAELARVHDERYTELARRECERLAESEYGMLSTGDTAIDRGSFTGALLAAGGTLAALDRLAVENRAAFALVRPPGHHAEPGRGMGFCLFNNAGIAAKTYALETGRGALIADFDYHHGNGSQALVDVGVAYVSTHASPAYPGTGDPRRNRIADGVALVNIPLAATGIETEAFVAIWLETLRLVAARMRPGLLVLSAGYDFAAGDPVGDLGVAPSAAVQLGRLAREIADTYCDGRALFVLEGGYDPPTLAGCVADTILAYESGAVADAADPAAVPARQRALIDATSTAA